MKLTLLAYLDGAGGLYPLSIFVPFPLHILHRKLTNEHSVLILLDVQVLEALQDQQLTLCRENPHLGFSMIAMAS